MVHLVFAVVLVVVKLYVKQRLISTLAVACIRLTVRDAVIAL